MPLGILDSKNITEEIIAKKCAIIQNGISLRKQAIGARLHDSMLFLKELLQKAFSLIYSNALESHSSLLLNCFSDVKILDATTLSLTDKVTDDYVGMGGRNAKTTLKIQTFYSAIKHSITYVDVTSGVTHDALALPKRIEELSKNELLLADILKQSNDAIEQKVYIGTDTHSKLKLRSVGIKLVDESAHKHIKKAILQNDGNDISSNKHEILHWNLMVTNVSVDVLNTTIITRLYRLRWQIEMLFSVLESTFL